MSIKSAEDRLASLARPDKWYLSGGDGILWAPPFPAWLHRPGFWDEAHVFYHPFAPLYSVALLDATGRETPLEPGPRVWRPDRLVQQWRALPPRGEPTVITETRTVLPGGRFRSAWTSPVGFGPVWLVAFTVQPGEATTRVTERDGGISWRRTVLDRYEQPLEITATLSFPGMIPAVAGAMRSQRSADQPVWAFTPFAEQWAAEDGTASDVRLEGLDASGSIYMAVAAPLAEGREVVVEMVLQPHRRPPPGSPPGDRNPWTAEFASHPGFRCSDTYLERYFDYRIYGLFLNRLAGDFGHLHYPSIAEGIGYFHVPITYSAQCQMLETRWRSTPDLAQGILKNFVVNQKRTGAFHGRIYPTHLRGTDFYHANWGDAIRAVDAVHRQDDFLAEVYPAMTRYGEWLVRTRDREGSGLFDVVDQFETGQEYMPRYQAVDPDADRYGWTNRIRLKGIDVTVYAYQLFRALVWMGDRLGRGADVDRWSERAFHTGYAIMDQMWDEDVGIFTDVDPETLDRTGVKCAVSFYPLLTDLLDEQHVRRLLAHLDNETEFATPYPVPSTSADDPLFDPHARWKGKRHVCPWNGRVWPMTNSHIVEGLLRQWQAGRRFVGEAAVRLLRRFVHMMFSDGDVNRPNCFEHYNPITGHPSVYRGIDDYQHSWVNDLLIRGVAGVEPREHHLLVDPLPVPVDDVAVSDLRLRGHTVWVTRHAGEIELEMDGRPYYGKAGTPMEIPW